MIAVRFADDFVVGFERREDAERFLSELAKLQSLKKELWRRMHRPVPEQGAYLSTVLQGHYRYYGVPLNTPAMEDYRFRVGALWKRTLQRRSQKSHLTWERMKRLIDRWLPKPRIYHPWPSERLCVKT